MLLKGHRRSFELPHEVEKVNGIWRILKVGDNGVGAPWEKFRQNPHILLHNPAYKQTNTNKPHPKSNFLAELIIRFVVLDISHDRY